MTPAEGNADQHIPLPRQALDDHIESLPTTWVYAQKRPHGGDRQWIGHIRQVGGREGDRLRNEIANVIADLLRWAQNEQNRDRHDKDGERK